MRYTPRTIGLAAELLHPPAQTDPGLVQRVHNQLFEGGSPTYSSFQVTPAGPVLSNPVTQPGAASQAVFLADRVQFREDLTSLTVEDFGHRVREIATAWAELRGLSLYLAQQVTLRTLVNPRNFADSREFLRRGVFRMGDEIESFGRDPQVWGLRLMFPPSQEQPNAFALRVESFSNDPRSLFLETQGTFVGPIHCEQGLEALETNVSVAYDFVLERVLPFVARFDARAVT